MHTRNRNTRTSALLAFAAASAVGLLAAGNAQAANIYISNSAAAADVASTSSYNNSGGANWWVNLDTTGAGAPVAGNDYFAEKLDGTGYNVRTPSGGLAQTFIFAGDSLHLTKANSALQIKSTTGSTFQVNLVMEEGSLTNLNGTVADYTLAGTITANGTTDTGAPAISNSAGKTVTVSSNIMGSGRLKLGTLSTSFFILNGDNSGYTGTVRSSGALTLASNNSIGGGTLLMSTSAPLTINSALSLGVGQLVIQGSQTAPLNMNFIGESTLGSINFLGTVYSVANGNAGETFGAVGTGATHEHSLFTGTGKLQVVPEPASLGLLALGGLTMLRRRR